jgi:hypothetical protein
VLDPGRFCLLCWRLPGQDDGVQPLDPGQRRELEYQLAQSGSWVHLSFLRRFLAATAMAAAGGSAFAFFVALAEGPWLLVGLLFFAVCDLSMLPTVLAPVRAAEWGIRLTFPTAEAMKRGDRNRSWPG